MNSCDLSDVPSKLFKMASYGSAKAMAVVPVIVVTAVWVIVGGVIPFFIKGQNKR